MDLLLWRHAQAVDAEPGADDLPRELTGRGRIQAQRMGQWLDRQLPTGTRVLCSPAVRAEQTVVALGRPYRVSEELAPDRGVQDLLLAAKWPTFRRPVLVVGHQPTLGQVAATLLGLPSERLSMRKGSVWWLRHRVRDGEPQTLIVTVQVPDLL